MQVVHLLGCMCTVHVDGALMAGWLVAVSLLGFPGPLLAALSASPRWGVDIHFDQAKTGEVEMLSSAFKVARMDGCWEFIVRTKPNGNVSHYFWDYFDALVSKFEANGVTPYWCFCCVHSNSSTGSACPGTFGSSPVFMGQFADFVAAAMERYRDRSIVFEILNEV